MWGLFLLTFGLPWVVCPGVENPYLEPKALLLTAVGWGMILWRHFRLPTAPSLGWRNPWTVWLGGCVVGGSLWKFQWMFLHRSPGQSRVIYNEYVWLACVSVLMALLLAHALSTTYLLRESSLQRLTKWMCWAAVSASAYGCFQSIGWDQWFMSNNNGQTPNPVWAGFGNPGYLALYLAILLPLFLIFAQRRYLLYGVLTVIALWLTQTRYAYAIAGIGVTASLLARWWTRMTRWQKGLAGLCCLSSLCWLGQVGYQILLTDDRLIIWKKALTVMQSHFDKPAWCMSGYGLESFGILLGGQGMHFAHNEWVQMLVEIGVIGTGLLFGMVLWSLRAGWRLATQSILASGWFGVWVAFLVATLMHFPTHIAPIAFIGLVAWSVMERQPEGV